MAETAQEYTQRLLSHVDGQDAIKVQKATAAKVKKLIRGLTPKQLKWKPEPGKWSIAEIVAHLSDAEIVISWRMRSAVGANGTEVQAYDQDAWAEAFQYGKRDAKQSVEVFRVLRENNLTMLKGLPREAWERYGMHQERGKESVAHVVRLIAGHDTNHLLQIERIVAGLREKKRK